MKTTCIINQKGGTGKTCTVINTAAILARDYGQRVLVVDADSQGNLTEFLAADRIRIGTLSSLLKGETAATVPTTLPKIDLLPADDDLIDLDIAAVRKGVTNSLALADWIDERRTRWDRVIIDCPPAFSAAAVAALVAADNVVIPVKVDAFGVSGVKNIMKQIQSIKRLYGGIEVAGVLPTMVYPGEEQKEKETQIRSALAISGIRTFRHIRRSTKLDEMTFRQEPLIYCSPKGKATYDYRVFVRELLETEGGDPHGV